MIKNIFKMSFYNTSGAGLEASKELYLRTINSILCEPIEIDDFHIHPPTKELVLKWDVRIDIDTLNRFQNKLGYIVFKSVSMDSDGNLVLLFTEPYINYINGIL